MADIFLPEVDSSEEQEYIFGVFANLLADHGERDSTNECSTEECGFKIGDSENGKSNTEMKDNQSTELSNNQKELKDVELNANENVGTEDQKTNQNSVTEVDKENNQSSVSNIDEDNVELQSVVQSHSGGDSAEVESNRGIEVESCKGIEVESSRGMEVESSRGIEVESCRGIEVESCRGIHVESSRDIGVKSSRGIEVDSNRGIEVESNRGIEIESNRGIEVESCRHIEVESCRDIEVESCRDIVVESCRGIKSESCRSIEVESSQGVEVESNRDIEESSGDANDEGNSESSQDETDSESKEDKNEEANCDSNMDIDDMFNFPPPSVNQLLSDLEGLADSEFIHHRQLAVKKILDCLRRAGSNQEHLQLVISVMCRLSEDEESMVRSELVQHIPSIALFCQGHSADLKRVIRQQLVPYTVKLLNDSQIGVRKLGQSALLILLEDGLIDQSQLGEWICPLVSQLTVCESNLEELRIEDVTVMTRMIPLVGRDITVKFFLEPYISLCTDPAFGIRKICAMGFGVLSRVVGTETTESSLLRVFHDLCNDAVWGVRKACADVFVDVATTVSLKTRKEVLPHIYISLLNDYSQYVKYAAYESLGGFIYTFADPSQTGLAYIDGKLTELPCLAQSQPTSAVKPPEMPVPELYGANSKCERLCNGEEDVWGEFKETLKCATRPKTDSIAVAAKDEHVFLHIDNENVFNTFQFWRTPLPEVELDIDIDGGKATSIHIRAKMPGSDGGPACTSEIKVRIASNDVSDSSESPQNGSCNDSKMSRMQVQTACINTITPSADQQNQLQIDTELSNSSYEEAVYTFKDNFLLGVKTKKMGMVDPKPRRRIQKQIEAAKEESPQMTPYDQDIVPPELLSRFISVANQHFPVYDVNKQYDEERIGYCAYSFPAVAFTLGRKNWPCIQSTCEKLAKDTKWTIRKTIASCLHELAAILGHDLTAKDLYPIFLDLMKDVDEVRMKLIMHLFEFLKQLQPTWRRMFLPLVEEFDKVDNTRNWRFRCAVAEQLRPTVELFDSFEILMHFLPIALGYVHDKVSAVRIAAVELIAVIVKHLMRDDGTKRHVQSLLKEFDVKHRQASKWVRRQTYVLLCEQLAEQQSLPMEMYTELVVPKLFTLAWDNVPNVRMAVSRCIAVTLVPRDYLPSIQKVNYEQLLQVMYNLQRDVDEDVRHFARMSATAFSVLPEKKLSPV